MLNILDRCLKSCARGGPDVFRKRLGRGSIISFDCMLLLLSVVVSTADLSVKLTRTFCTSPVKGSNEAFPPLSSEMSPAFSLRSVPGLKSLPDRCSCVDGTLFFLGLARTLLPLGCFVIGCLLCTRTPTRDKPGPVTSTGLTASKNNTQLQSQWT